jgi:hypothetical protein
LLRLQSISATCAGSAPEAEALSVTQWTEKTELFA